MHEEIEKLTREFVRLKNVEAEYRALTQLIRVAVEYPLGGPDYCTITISKADALEARSLPELLNLAAMRLQAREEDRQAAKAIIEKGKSL